MKKEKQIDHHQKYHHKKYAKPYRKRHILGLTVFSVATICSLVFLGASYSQKIFVIDDTTENTITEERLDKVVSSEGFSFDIPTNTYRVFIAETLNDPLVSSASPYSGNFAKVQLKTDEITSNTDTALAKLTVEKRPAKEYDTNFAKTKSEQEALKNIASFSVANFIVENIKSEKTKLNSQEFYSFEYALSPTQSGSKIYVKKWVKYTPDGVYVITADNLLNLNYAESAFAVPIRTIQIGQAPKYEKLSGSIFPKKTSTTKKNVTADEVSPSVVKIYHFVCGELILNGVKLTNDTCDGNVGSGFYVGSQGQIATNGHVVTLTPADFLINLVSNNPDNIRILLKFMGMTDKQIASQDPEKLALSLMSSLYDLPEDRLKISNYRDLTIVAGSSESLKFKNVDDVKKLFDFSDTRNLMRAKIMARDYSAKDIANLNNQKSSGFSAGDTAILKVALNNTPYFALANTDAVNINSKITVIGFPSDAENQLTDNSNISPTVTTGTISAKRSASGNSSRLFQSDADASQGNSGGPVVNELGEAIGLLTYRYKDDTSSNAAKSYIRDIKDISELASGNNLELGGDNQTMLLWQRGLEYFKDSHYSAALKDFAKVQELYPAHRLVNEYASKASEAVRAGKDRPLTDARVLILAIISFIGVVGTVLIAIMVHKHHIGHQIHKNLNK